MAKYNVGDKVVIKNCMKNGCISDGYIALDMLDYGGKTATITEVSGNEYHLDIDNGEWWWFNSCFEDVTEAEAEAESQKPRYEVGDYVRIRSDIQQMIDDDIDVYVGIVQELTEYAGKLARITKVEEDIRDKYSYKLDVDNGDWWWCNELFEYRLGNYEDNKIENRRFKYVIGYRRYLDKLETFEGFIENFYPSGKSAFVDENGKLLVVPYERIEFIIPKESDND